jgi:asparagine synthase (glutamine-hydrolysing)
MEHRRRDLVVVLSDVGLVGVYDDRGIAPDEAAALIAATGGIEVDLRRPHGCIVVGDVYSAEALARELGTGETNVERLIELGYVAFGRDVLSRLRGSFLAVITDERAGHTLVAVDQLGGHSPYLWSNGSRLVFASELRALLAALPSRPQPDATAVAHWLAGRTLPDRSSLYDGVSRLSGGEYLELARGSWRRRVYWAPTYVSPFSLGRDDAVDRIWATVRGSVQERIAAGGKIGVIMSGGVDSSAVATAAMEVTTGAVPPRGYSAVFPGHRHPRVDESRRIDELIEGIGIPNVQLELEPVGALSVSLDFLEMWDLPAFGAGYLIERSLLDRARHDGIEVILDGQGGDELFALSGYLLADLLRRGRLRSSLGLTRRLPGGRGRSIRELAAAWRYYAINGLIPTPLHAALRRMRANDSQIPAWLAPSAASMLSRTDDAWAWKRSDAPRWWAHKAYLLTQVRQAVGMHDYLRHRAGVSGMKARPALLDLSLVELALRIPPDLEFDPDYDRPLIREAMRGRTPDSVRLAVRKSNLAPFYRDALAGEDLAAIRCLLTARDAEIGAYVRRDAVAALVEQPKTLDEPGWDRWATQVWLLTSAECWLRFQADRGFADRLRSSPGVHQPRSRVRRLHEPLAGN